MGNNNTILVTGILTTALAIVLVETGVIKVSGSFIYGDDKNVPLILKKADETFEINPGDRVVINDHVYTYKSVDMISQVVMMEKGSISLGNVNTINYVTGTRMKELGLKGFLTGGLAGTAVGVAMIFPSGEYHYMIFTVPVCAALDATVFSIAGAGIGYTKKNYTTYVLGKDDWSIVNQ